MPQTISKSESAQIIGGAFSNRENANEAVQALKNLGIPEADIQVVVMLNGAQAQEASTEALRGQGMAESEALFYEKAVQNGKVLVAVHNVTDAAPVIEVFDDHQAEYNPNGWRNLRQDVVGLTAGATAGAVAGGLAGVAAAGPIGGALGAAAGAVVGGGAGAAAGKAAEHRK